MNKEIYNPFQIHWMCLYLTIIGFRFVIIYIKETAIMSIFGWKTPLNLAFYSIWWYIYLIYPICIFLSVNVNSFLHIHTKIRKDGLFRGVLDSQTPYPISPHHYLGPSREYFIFSYANFDPPSQLHVQEMSVSTNRKWNGRWCPLVWYQETFLFLAVKTRKDKVFFKLDSCKCLNAVCQPKMTYLTLFDPILTPFDLEIYVKVIAHFSTDRK